MRKVHVALALAVAVTTPACTVLMLGTSAAGVAAHNNSASEKDQWGYAAPVAVAAAFGLIIDYYLWSQLTQLWAKPMS
jgi:hypothetical protein